MVSEFMLQQTQASQVERLLPPFLKRFPTAKALANASTADVIRAWQGLGYNRRALNLHRAAQAITALRCFPRTREELIGLPGIGAYTSSAILAFAFNEDVGVVDVNIERVLSRLWERMPTTAAVLPIKHIEQLDLEILPKGQSAAWHEALMDFGATICTKRAPKCLTCPLLHECPSGNVFLRSPDSRGEPSVSREKKFQGSPRRIWRGRVLGIITDHGPITKAALLRALASNHSYRPESDGELISTILQALEQEGFVTRTRSRYSLTS